MGNGFKMNSKAVNPDLFEDGCKPLELSNRLYSLYVRAGYDKNKFTFFWVVSSPMIFFAEDGC
jgi:hypothetical protein